MRVSEDKKKVSFNGPFYGQIKKSQLEADDEAKKLTDSSKGGAIVAKVFKIPNSDSFASAMKIARPIFDRIKRDILEIKQVIDRPIRKCKKH